MKDLFTIERLKYVGAGAIVLTAFGLMLPQVTGFAFSLARVGTTILIAVVVSAIVAFGWQFLRGKGKSPDQSKPGDSRSE